MKKRLFLLLAMFLVAAISYGGNIDDDDALGALTHEEWLEEFLKVHGLTHEEWKEMHRLTPEELEDYEELQRILSTVPTVEIDTNEIIFPSGLRWNEVDEGVLEYFR
jgi:hypothetical protein